MDDKIIEALISIEKKISDVMFDMAITVEPKSEEERESVDRAMTDRCVDLITEELSHVSTELKIGMLIKMLRAHIISNVNSRVKIEALKNSRESLLERLLSRVKDGDCDCDSCVEKRNKEEKEKQEGENEADK